MSDSSLTPIRVRGKRYSKRQLEASKQSGVDLKQKSSKRKKLSRASSAHYASNGPFGYNEPEGLNLLSLPSELLETIFLYSLEFNFPRASSRLAAAVSRERIYKILILLAFWNDPGTFGRSPGSFKDEGFLSKAFVPFTYSCLPVTDQKMLQRDVFGCRWCTFSRVKRYVPEIYNLSLYRLLCSSGDVELGLPVPLKDTGLLDEIFPLQLQEWDDTWSGFHEEDSNTQIELEVNPLNIALRHNRELVLRILPIRVLVIPGKLLRGDPWTDDKISFLEYLILNTEWGITDALKRREPLQSQLYDQETLQAGIHEAIVEQNPRALRALLELDEFATRSRDTEAEYEIPAGHFITAVRAPRNDAVMLKLLVRGSAESIPYDDPEITAWATTAAVERRDKFAAWLLKLMTLVPQLLRMVGKGYLFRYGTWRGAVPQFSTEFHDVFGAEADTWRNEMCSYPLRSYMAPHPFH